MLSLLAFSCGALLLGFALNRVFIRFSQKMGAVNAGTPAQVRWDTGPKPLVGGIVFYLVFLLGAVAAALVLPAEAQHRWELMPLLLGGTVGFLVGLWDDAYNTVPLLKFIGQVVCGVLMLAFGVRIELFGIWAVDALLTVFWIVGIMNSFNMIDNMDGVSGTLSLGIHAAVLVLMAGAGVGNPLLLAVLLSLVGVHVAFLLLNWNPSKLYMGDTGSQFLGFVLAYLGIRFLWNHPGSEAEASAATALRQVLLPLLVFSMTILDTAFVTVARLARRQSPFVGGRDHTTHHMAFAGVPQRWVAIVVGMVTTMSAVLAYVLLHVGPVWTITQTVVSVLYLAALTLVFYYVYRLGGRKQKLRELQAERHAMHEAMHEAALLAAANAARMAPAATQQPAARLVPQP